MSRWRVRLREWMRRRIIRYWTPRARAQLPVRTDGDTVTLAAGRDFRGD